MGLIDFSDVETVIILYLLNNSVEDVLNKLDRGKTKNIFNVFEILTLSPKWPTRFLLHIKRILVRST